LVGIKGASVVLHSPQGCASTVGLAFDSHEIDFTRRKVACTRLFETDIVMGAAQKLEDLIRQADKTFGSKSIFVVGTCAADIIGEDLEGICARMQPEIGGQLIPVFSGGFRGNYYDGIDLGLNALFPFIEKSAVHTSRTVNLIAPQVSINPTWWADFTWVKETLAKIGISVQSVISHNTSMCELKEAASAAANILLTQDAGRKFCKRMEDELGVPTILSDLPMPIGMNNTNRWLRAIGEHFGVQSEVEKVITDGEKVVVDVLRRRALMIIPRYRNCHVAVSADATFGIGLLRMLFEELEMIPDLLLIRSDADDTRKVLQKELDDLRISPNIVMGVDGYKIKKALSDAEPDAVIGSSWEKYIAEEVGIKLAFDCFAPTNRVSYVDRSYFGYQGMLNLLEVVANDWETAFRSKEIDPALLS
jgi:light-independent protochlorophyllide reductase B subunit